MKEDTNKWRDVPWLWIKRCNVIKMPVLPNLINKFRLIPINSQKTSVDVKNWFKNFHVYGKDRDWSKNNFEKLEQIARLTPFDFSRSNIKSQISRWVYWCTDRNIDQWIRTEVHKLIFQGRCQEKITGRWWSYE